MIHTDLKDRVALVTGGSRGIGAAVAGRLGACGARVFLTYRERAQEAQAVAESISAAGGSATCLAADLGDPEQIERLFDEVQQQAGRLDILVNNAGITRDGLLLMQKDKDWRDVLDVNLDGVWRATRRALKGMLRQRSGRIVNVASVSAIRGGRGQANYAAAKAGVVALTRAAALELADRGIQVNAVLPGFIATDMTAMLQRRAGDEILARIPAGRYGTPQDVAGMVLFLVSDDAAWITGQAFVVDGGMSQA